MIYKFLLALLVIGLFTFPVIHSLAIGDFEGAIFFAKAILLSLFVVFIFELLLGKTFEYD